MAGRLTAVRRQAWAASHLVRSGMIAPMRPDKYVGMARIFRTYGSHATSGFALAANRNPDGIGLIDDRGSLTWSEIVARGNALAVGLAAVSDRPVTSVAILCRNHRGFVDALLAAARLGVPALLLNTGFSGPQLADVLEREQGTLIVYDDEFDGLLDEARRRIDGLTEVVSWSQEYPVDRVSRGLSGTAGPDNPQETLTTPAPVVAEDLIDAHRGEAPEPTRPGRVVLLTSGTTGTPKGANRTGGGPDELAAMLARIPWRAEERILVAAPTFHAWGFGQLVIAAVMTCTIVMTRRFDPEATLRLADEHRVQGISVVPVMLERIVDLPEEVLERYTLDSVRFVSASGSRMRADAVLGFMDRFGDVVHNSYNATEAGQISVAGPADLRAAPDTAGRPVEGTVLRIVDDDGHDVPTGEVGRIVLQGASQFEGYTAGDSKDFLDGYMVSGDVGRLDAEGRLYVVGRDDDMIVSGGENVYPLEVERAIAELPGVREVVVVGVDDERFGQRLAAYVVADDLTADDVQQHVRAQLAGYKVPRDVVFLPELPRNASGKIVVRELPRVSTGSTTDGRACRAPEAR